MSVSRPQAIDPYQAARRLLALCLLIAVLVVGASLHEQQRVLAQSARFEGQVTDLLSGEPVAGALVHAGQVQVSTNAGGGYRLEVLPGTYEIGVQADGYIGMSATRQKAQQGTSTPVSFELVVASPSAAQRDALDRVFVQYPGPQPSAAELEIMRVQGFQPTGVEELPATIRVLMPDGIVVVMGLDEYIRGVLPSEMPPHWPTEALKAQAVAARSYAVTGRRHADVGADVCTTVHCQVWSPIHYETTDHAVDSTHNVAATHSADIIRAFFHAHCDGHTMNSEDVWQAALPYCRSVACPCGFEAFHGHGVGMCQQGARVLAEQGLGFAQILTHYYTHVQVAALGPHSLGEGRVFPEQGDERTLFTYEVWYEGADLPIAANLYIDGHTFSMTAVPTAASWARLYRYTTPLSAGTHSYAFRFEDGYNPAIVLPAEGSLKGPVVASPANGPTTPTPQPSGTQGWQWTQSTEVDFLEGLGHNTQLTEEGDGEIRLAADHTLGVYTSTIKLAPIDFVAVGSRWLDTVPPGTELTIDVRSSPDSRVWSSWQSVPPMDAEREVSLLSHGELIYGRGPYLQYRATFASSRAGLTPVLSWLTLIAIDSRFGPTADQALAASISPPEGGPVIISRAAWGADESLWDWPAEYRPVRKFVVHHTATPNGDLDPAATVRAIYYYHAVTRGWGDIGYNYLIDTEGRIYEGRRGGEGVVGGHAKQYAWGSIGFSFIGNYEEAPLPRPAEDSAVELIAWKGNLHFVDPRGEGFFIDQDLPNVMGHRDGSQTTCPGSYAYARLPAIRLAAWNRMAYVPPSVRLDAPDGGAPVGGVVDLIVSASPWVGQVAFYVDGELRATDTSEPYSWKWNAERAEEGTHELRAVAQAEHGLTAEHTRTVQVDRTPPAGSVSAPVLSNSPDVQLQTPCDDATQMVLGNGWQWEGEDLTHEVGRVVEDAEARNRKAVVGEVSRDAAGWWYGPYYKELPTGRSYRVYFRLKSADANTTSEVAAIDVVDNLGRNILAADSLVGQDLSGALVYDEPHLDFQYYRRDTYGIEFRTRFAALSDLYLDRVDLFSAPRSYRSSLEWTLPDGDGPKEVTVRYIDAAGNVSPVYSVTIILDTEAPQWLDWDGAVAQVRDSLSGLRVNSAEFASSGDGGETWSSWRPAQVDAADGTTVAVAVRAREPEGTHLKFRASDLAGNSSQSAAFALPQPIPTTTGTPGPTAVPTATPSPSPTASATRSPTPSATTTPTSTPSPTATASPSPTPTTAPSATPTTAPAFGLLRGRVLLQGRSSHEGTTVELENGAVTTTNAEGRYLFSDLSPGSHVVSVRYAGYLEAQHPGVLIPAGSQITLTDLTLRAGDPNGDCVVDLFDLIKVASSLGELQPGAADLNSDGAVDVFDLILVSSNFGLSCPIEWSP